MSTNLQYETALRMIPTLVYWAKYETDITHYYSDLSLAAGYSSPRIGNILVTLQQILDNLSQRTGKHIPTLNSLVCNKVTGLPSSGFGYVSDDYTNLSKTEQTKLINQLNHTAARYDWTWVLHELDLEPLDK
ncbi:MAG: hypothetical protein MJZ93_06195 [Paludibacteraceae bacterium]|nr:hypothetical protein [Paludibacteraceae bacterium]